MITKRERRQGFTLVEIMVTVSVMAIISGIVTFNIVQQLPAWRLKQAQYQILSDFRKARMEAVARGIDVRVSVNTGAETYTLWADRNRNGSADEGESTTGSIADIGGVAMGCYPSVMTFKPNGTMTSAYYYQYIYVYNAYQYRYIYSFPSGQVDPWPQEG